LVGAIYAAGQLENFERQVRQYEWTDVLAMFDPVWPRSGLMSGRKGLDRLAAGIREWRIEDLAIPFSAVAVDLVSGEEIHIREGPVIDAVRASVAIPGIFVPQRRGRQLLVHLARVATSRGCGRFEWSVLDWNEVAIRSYRRAGAVPLDEWTVYRVTGDALDRLADDDD